jgi:hypothetical protein
VILRRRRLPGSLEPAFEAFRLLVPGVERAKAVLLEAVPGTRVPGRPLADALAEFEEALDDVRAAMEGWRAPEVAPQWERASAGLERTIAMARRVRTEALEPAGFEGLIGLIDGLLAPLETFAGAAERFRELRR